MTSTIISALLPIVVTLLLGFAAGWHHDFDAKQAAILNRMVMLYALPLSLFVGLLGTPRDEVLREGPLALWIFLAMLVPFGITVVLARYVSHRDLMTSSLQALAIAGPAVPFVGVSVLGGPWRRPSCPAEVGSQSIDELAAERDEMLLGLIELRTKGASESRLAPAR